MTLLSRYLVRQNLFLFFTILLVGTGLYILTDIFERLDNFMDGDAGPRHFFLFFLYKIPSIISLILPAVYLIAMVVQLNLLSRNRETIALAAGGVSPSAFVRFIVVYGIAWVLLQLVFAQFLGTQGEKAAARIWQEDVRGNVLKESSVKGIWFTDHDSIVHIDKLLPVQKKGTEILIYTLDSAKTSITEIIRAKEFAVDKEGKWIVLDGKRLVPAEYSSVAFEKLTVPLTQDLEAFQLWSNSSALRPTYLSLTELWTTISHLKQAGSNVERLLTAWHGKLAYAFSVFIMGLLAYIVSRQTSNIYLALVSSLLIVFFYYTANTLCVTLGEKGIVSPLVGAWSANAFFAGTGLVWIFKDNILRGLRLKPTKGSALGTPLAKGSALGTPLAKGSALGTPLAKGSALGTRWGK